MSIKPNHWSLGGGGGGGGGYTPGINGLLDHAAICIGYFLAPKKNVVFCISFNNIFGYRIVIENTST